MDAVCFNKRTRRGSRGNQAGSRQVAEGLRHGLLGLTMMPPTEQAKTEHHCIHDDDGEEEENMKQEREGCQRGGGAVACKSAHAEAHAESL
jgi:hypothetical protein